MRILISIIIMILLAAITVKAQQNDFPKLTGPYLGQTPPAGEPALFAPGIVSTKTGFHSSATISPDGKEIYWEVETKIWFSKLENDKWTEPEMVSFCKGDSYLYGNPFITPDGIKMYFTSTRPGAVSKEKETIWYAERTPSGLLDPKPVNSDVNEMGLHWSISVSASGTLCFQGSREDSYGGLGDIYYSPLVNGVHAKPVNIGPEINSQATETCPYIAPDESYIIFNRFDQANLNKSGIYISYRDKSGKWLPAVFVLGGSPDKGGMCPRISPDGKYLFYVNRGMYWMPAGFIEKLRPKGK